jgi:hypothetical protein
VRRTPFVLFLLFSLAAFGAIRSYDLFWQLATGRWIVEHRGLPLTDPFALASEQREWIDGEWLYEVALYGAHSLVGLEGLSIVRGLLAALIFTLAFLHARRETETHVALLASAVAFAGAMAVLDLRPSGVAALMVVLMLAAKPFWARVLIAVIWINVHPSALLAPIIGALASPPAVAPASRAGSRAGGWMAAAIRFVVLAAALLLNPYGWKAIVAPIELTMFVRSGAFVNAEWLPSPPLRFPILYVCIAIAIAATATQPKRNWWRIALLAMFAMLAVRHVRNQPLFFAAFPMLVPLPSSLSMLRPRIAYLASAAAIALIALTNDHRLGVAPERFPVNAVAQLKASGLRGNIYNPDQFGGYLIWSFYPERRVLTDGRNELYRTFIPEWQQARGDGRKWNELLRKYKIDLAVEEYREPLRITDAATGKVELLPAEQAYWPRTEWMLIAKDDAAMVFARKAAFPRLSRLSSRGRADS